MSDQQYTQGTAFVSMNVEPRLGVQSTLCSKPQGMGLNREVHHVQKYASQPHCGKVHRQKLYSTL
jgi:hypothetical protein